MSADVLREAAALMRTRAEAVQVHTPAPWAHPWTFGDPSDGPTRIRVISADGTTIVHTDYTQYGDEQAEHIASWHPAVALTVADWLEVVARRWPTGRSSVTRERASALAVARAYLGDTSDPT